MSGGYTAILSIFVAIMSLRKFLFFLSVFLPGVALAQQQFTIKGVIYKKDASERVAQAIITDLKTQTIMMSDELGIFSIQTAKGDTLLISKKLFADQKLVVTDANDMVIYMTPVVQLAEVTVRDKSDKQELNDVVNTYRSKGLYDDGKPSVLSFLASPITGLHELFSQDAANERHFIRFSKEELEANEVDRRYTPQLVKRVTGLSDDDVVKFMQQYRPSYEDLQQWNDYDLINHIKKYLVYFNTHKNDAPVDGNLNN
jgi:hypothetical protein